MANATIIFVELGLLRMSHIKMGVFSAAVLDRGLWQDTEKSRRKRLLLPVVYRHVRYYILMFGECFIIHRMFRHVYFGYGMHT